MDFTWIQILELIYWQENETKNKTEQVDTVARPHILGERVAASVSIDSHLYGGLGHRMDRVFTTHLW